MPKAFTYIPKAVMKSLSNANRFSMFLGFRTRVTNELIPRDTTKCRSYLGQKRRKRLFKSLGSVEGQGTLYFAVNPKTCDVSRTYIISLICIAITRLVCNDLPNNGAFFQYQWC